MQSEKIENNKTQRPQDSLFLQKNIQIVSDNNVGLQGKNTEKIDEEIYDVIIIGAGISGLMAADILLREEKKVLVIQANSTAGGIIKNYTIGQTMQYMNYHAQWLQESEDIKNTAIEIGASQILSTHTFMIKLVEQYDLTLLPYYHDGKFLYFKDENEIKQVNSLMDLYFNSEFQKTITKLLAKISNISKNIIQIHDNTINNPSKKYYRKMLYEYIQKFDQKTCKQFLEQEIQDEELRKMVINQFQIVQSLSVDRLSILQVLMHGYGLQNLQLFTSSKPYFTEKVRIKEGVLSLIQGLKDKVCRRAKKIGLKNPIVFKESVSQIKNEINSQVEIITSKRSYKCYKVFYTAALGRANNIKISKLSPSKRLIFENQISQQVQKIFIIFESAFWRSKFSGSGVYSDQFPFSEISDVSPSNLCCGILCLILCGKKPLQWQEKFQQYHTKQEKHQKMENYLRKMVANAFLDGNIQDHNLKKMVVIPASLKANFGYQTYTKMGICLQLENVDEDYLECYTRDEHNIIFLGGQLSKKFASCMEGAVRYTRQKIYKYLQIPDPWNLV